ncbi:MAG: SDR family oxidoreductase [Thermodesulfobacteriota bacterium]|nr:SDR family oxidoreductase [Thermodesulfobacteriota bacterium]
MDLDYKGKTVVVTGGGSNIGRAISLTFAKEGANVVIGDVDTEQAEKVAKEANALNAGGKTITAKCDVTNIDDVQAMFKKGFEEFGQIDVLVNNVGWDNIMLFVDTTPEFWNKVITINYVGVLNCTKTALDYMIEKKSGAIVSISSDASRQGEFREAVYGGVKAAVNSFMKTIGRENGRHGIRTNVVCPGVTVPSEDVEIGEKSMWKQAKDFFTPEQLEKIAKAYPLRKIGKPQDIANAVVFLGSNKAAGHITGQVLSVSGGYSMVG